MIAGIKVVPGVRPSQPFSFNWINDEIIAFSIDNVEMSQFMHDVVVINS